MLIFDLFLTMAVIYVLYKFYHKYKYLWEVNIEKTHLKEEIEIEKQRKEIVELKEELQKLKEGKEN